MLPANPSQPSLPATFIPSGDGLTAWAELYLAHGSSASARSRVEQRRDIGRFLDFMVNEEGTDHRPRWTPRLSRAFMDFLRGTVTPQGQRAWSDRTINRVLAHVKTFARWVHRFAPFPLGDPAQGLPLKPLGAGLEVERALTSSERRRLLDAADRMPLSLGVRRDRKRFRDPEDRPRRKFARPWRSRAIIYCLVETGMRRAAACTLILEGILRREMAVRVTEKGGLTHEYGISAQGMAAIRDYLEKERELDARHWKTNVVFLPAAGCPGSRAGGRLDPVAVTRTWDQACRLAGITGRTPHSARHAMGRHLMEKTGNIAAVQRQLGHRNVGYSIQYARITRKELQTALDERE